MQVINWLELQPLLADVDLLNARLQEARPVREVCRFLADIILQGYPWPGRSDLIPCYHPARTYREGQWIALPVPDSEESQPTAWQVAQVRYAENTGNAIQGRFQALVLDVGGREIHKSGGIPGATFPELELSRYGSEELGKLGEWVADTYAGALLTTLKKLIQKGRICGQVTGDTFLPEQLFSLSMDRLHPFFDRLSSALRWVSIEEILLGLPDLADLKHETARALIRATLKVSPYQSLGGDRWTTRALFDQLNREVPSGLPGPHLRSNTLFWTEQDKKDLAVYKRKPIPAVASHALEELGLKAGCSGQGDPAWQNPEGLIRLPPLSYLHVTQAYFPVGKAMQAFSPDTQMVFVRFMDDDYHPFLLDRERCCLKAVNPESLQKKILEAGIPAGTYLWLDCQGDEKYRIFPRPLSSSRWVSCKFASCETGSLHVEPGQMQISFECDPFVFKANLSAQELATLPASAKAETISVLDAIISVLQEICAADPDNRAHRSEIFNGVFLKRLCSPDSVAALLYSQPCFTRMQGDYFRYKPMPDRQVTDIWKQTNRASQLWEELVVNCVPPDPGGKEQVSPRIYAGLEDPLPSMLVPETEPALLFAAPEIFTRSSSPDRVEGRETREITLREKISTEVKHALEYLTEPVDDASEGTQSQNCDPEILPDSHEEREKSEPLTPSVDVVFSPSPAWIKVSLSEIDQPTSVIDTRRMAYGLKIPARPLHKRPIYQRIFFCLRGWIHMISGRGHDQNPR